MKKSVRFAGILAGALAFSTLVGVSANADTRPQDESSWRQSRGDDRYDRNDRRDSRRDDRDFLSGRVERVDHRRNVVLLRGQNGRTIVVQMVRNRNHRGIDVDDLRRGDYVTFVGDWSRGGFQAWRIEDVDRGRGGRGRDRW